VSYTITITRGDNYVQSYDVWAHAARYPSIDGDGVFVANVPISTNASSVVYSWTSPTTGTWKFVAIARRHDVYSAPKRAT
jgi:hypothetical protein